MIGLKYSDEHCRLALKGERKKERTGKHWDGVPEGVTKSPLSKKYVRKHLGGMAQVALIPEASRRKTSLGTF